MSFFEILEGRTLMSAGNDPVVPNPFARIIHSDPNSDYVAAVGGPTFYSNAWSVDVSGEPESPPIWTNSVSGAQFTGPTLSDSGRLQITGTSKADTITSEQVTGINTNSDLPAIIFEPTTAGEMEYQHSKFISDFIPSESDKIPDGQGGFESAPQLTQDYQQALADKQANPPSGWSQDDVTEYNNIIASINISTKHYDEQVERFKNVSFTVVHVAGKYDVYVESPDTPITIAVDAGAGNDTISIAPNVTAKTSVLGGKGNDTLISGKMHSYLAGGAGNDRLVSRSTHGGTMEGGPGSDTLDCRVGKMNLSGATSADYVVLRGQSYPMATAASALSFSVDHKDFSDVLITPNGLI